MLGAIRAILFLLAVLTSTDTWVRADATESSGLAIHDGGCESRWNIDRASPPGNGFAAIQDDASTPDGDSMDGFSGTASLGLPARRERSSARRMETNGRESRRFQARLSRGPPA